MQKRKIIIGTYDTAEDGLWTLSAWALSRASAMENYAEVPGHGLLDLSTVLTDGEPYYSNREFEAVLESSEGTRQEREERISAMINQLDGWRMNIILPDDPTHYITGRVRVERLYNDLAHASVRVTATCDPWRYNNTETTTTLTATATEQTATLVNQGRLSVVPYIKIEGGTVRLKFSTDTETYTWEKGAFEGRIGDLYLTTGSSPLIYSGTGTITLKYREAVL